MNQIAPNRLWLPAATLTLRELQRFARQRSRMLGAFATPVIFWLLIGAGIGRSFSTEVIAGNTSYLEYFFPGTFALIVLFTAIFSSMSLIEDRHEGFLQSVLVAPASRSGIALGKIVGSTILALLQGALFLLLAPVAGIELGLLQVVAVLAAAALMAFALAGLGFIAAWKLDSSQGFHAIMNLVFIPMWILSGALFPAEGASAWLSFLLVINPLTYGVAMLRHAMYPAELLAAGQIPSWSLSFFVTAAFAAIMFLGSVALLRRSDAA
jgi:ABC-2 type transport system permease protein